jgi:hypothetical protein
MLDASIRGSVACRAAGIASMVTEGAQQCQAFAGYKQLRRIAECQKKFR